MPSLAAAAELGTSCTPATELCLDPFLRFAATATYEGPGGNEAPAILVQPAGGRRGYFTTGDRRFTEVWAEVISAGCQVNGHFWVKVLGLSDRGMVVTVSDLQTGSQRTYQVPAGVPGPTVADIQGFPCDPPPVFVADPSAPQPAAPEGIPALTLVNGRFEISGQASTAADGLIFTAYSGGLAYFGSQHSLIKLVPNLATGFFELTAASSAESTITVVDTCLNQQAQYFVLSGATTSDADAFPLAATTCGLFADGFETGTTTAWNLATE